MSNRRGSTHSAAPTSSSAPTQSALPPALVAECKKRNFAKKTGVVKQRLNESMRLKHGKGCDGK